MSRPRQGRQVKRVYSIRIEPRIKKKIDKKYGSLSKMLAEIIKGLK